MQFYFYIHRFIATEHSSIAFTCSHKWSERPTAVTAKMHVSIINTRATVMFGANMSDEKFRKKSVYACFSHLF
jgi:hypothetical protein